ncbi:MAG: hypothetical protein JKY65_15140 [Planctomycetes bacterium]|nr:hypothetical protein [Planctomycetota bacterium]
MPRDYDDDYDDEYDDDRPPETINALDAIIPTNPLAALSCYAGIFGLLLCPLGPILGPLAVFLGVAGLKAWKVQETGYGKTTSAIRAWIGIVTGVIATILGLFVVGTMFMGRS